MNLTSVHRKFTTEQSSAINSITIDGTSVVIVYHSNTDKAYTFNATPSYAEWLGDLLSNDEQLQRVSIGSTIADARRTEELTAVW